VLERHQKRKRKRTYFGRTSKCSTTKGWQHQRIVALFHQPQGFECSQLKRERKWKEPVEEQRGKSFGFFAWFQQRISLQISVWRKGERKKGSGKIQTTLVIGKKKKKNRCSHPFSGSSIKGGDE
jgi:hypothetical protein